MQVVQPVIQAHGVLYERTHFRRLLESSSSLEGTKLWIRHSLGRDRSEERIEMVPFIGGALVHLIADYPHWGGTIRDRRSIDRIPETLRMDLLRIKALNAHFHTDCMCMIVVASLPREVGAWAAEVVKKHPPRLLDQSEMLKIIGEGLASEHGRTQEEAAALVERVGKHLKRTHAIYEAMVGV